jgi:hypothetical protein
LLQAWARDGYLWTRSNGELVDHRLLFMRADLGAHVSFGQFRAAGQLGLATHGSTGQSQQAWVTHSSTGVNLVSREHWAGFAFADEGMLLRAGRMNLPFGLRNVEHTSWVRSESRTEINQNQQHGVAFAYTRDPWRGEIMAILGNFQVNGDRFRERGYSAYVGRALAHKLEVGLSSKATHARADILLGVPLTRHAHGAFARYSVFKPLVLLGEADLLIAAPSNGDTRTGGAGWLQIDVEPWQGLHVDVAGELLRSADLPRGTRQGLWTGVWWFFLPHFDLRADAILRGGGDAPGTVTYIAQAHGYL